MTAQLSFYVHIPYCVKRCGYCDFNTYTPSELREGGTLEMVSNDYIDAVLKEIEIARATAPGAVPTIFFGGGTPSLLPAHDLGRVIAAIKSGWNVSPDCEITLEANPDSVDASKLKQFREAGFNRVSFGMQSAQPHVLATLDRTHNPENVLRAIEGARAAGFSSVSVDLIYGTPGESLEDWRSTVESALALGVDHISAYALIVESGTKLANQIKRGELSMPDDDLMADMYLLVDRLAQESGLSWYELSNWSKSGHESQHNIAYWKNANWWGLGPGAHSHKDGVRWWNIKHPTAYKAALFAGTTVIAESEVLTPSQLADEAIMLPIRMREGIALANLSPEQISRVSPYSQSGHVDPLKWESGILQLTPEGRLIADRIVRELVV
ncbi:MAG: coproporphyrinogen III oxidase [Streptomycetaceae bacterium]|nr:MAG: coproporphyrinogen III oxidase [Streptomycetaceae bacterium]